MPSHDKRELESMYGPSAKFSEHKRGIRNASQHSTMIVTHTLSNNHSRMV